MRLPSLLLLLAACASGPGLRATTGGPQEPRCPARGGSLAVVDAASGEPLACTPLVVWRRGERLFAGETDARGLVPVEVTPGETLTVKTTGEAIQAAVSEPAAGLAVLELGDPEGRVRVVGPDGQPLGRIQVSLRRGGKAVFSGITSPFGVLAGAPEDLRGVFASAPGSAEAPVDTASRTVTLEPADPEP